MILSQAPSLLPAGKPRLVGIVNITEDSFSDGGRYLAAADALACARLLRSEGADIIELGPAASHPDSARVTAEEEQRRLAPVLEPLAADGIPVCVDSFLPETQRFAISRGVAYLNDIQGFPHPSLYGTLAASGCQLVVMHSVQRTGPATRMVTDPAAIWAGIGRFFAGRLAALQAAGITRIGSSSTGARLLPGQQPRAIAGGPSRNQGTQGSVQPAGAGLAIPQVVPPRADRLQHRKRRARKPCRRTVRRQPRSRLHPHP